MLIVNKMLEICISIGNESKIIRVSKGRWSIVQCWANFLLKCQVTNSLGFVDQTASFVTLFLTFF